MAKDFKDFKDFKDYDRAFSAEDIKECRRKYLVKDVDTKQLATLDDIEGIRFWAHGYVQPDQRDVQYAVYTAESHMDWQLFRVSLKGLSTKHKLKMLYNRWARFMCDLFDYGMFSRNAESEWDRRALEWVRINNYIGALRRGGQLDARLQVVK